MALPLVQITGTILTPDGDPVASGEIVATLSAPMSVSDGVVAQRIAAAVIVKLGADGVLPDGTSGTRALRLVPNDAGTPVGTYYDVLFRCRTPGGEVVTWREVWEIASSPASIAIGDVPRRVSAPAVPGWLSAAPVYTSSTLPTASATWGGRAVRVRDPGSDEAIQWCVLLADGSYAWRAQAQRVDVQTLITAIAAASPADAQSLFNALTNPVTHPAGYAAGPTEFWVQGPDTTAPTVTAFAVDATSSSLVVAVSSFTATDDVAVTGYMVTESATPPAADATGWSATAPTSVTASAPGTITFYAWAKDATGNVSAALSGSCEITVVDTAAPTVTGFDVPATSDSRTIAVNTFTATDDVGVTGYMITESGTPPLASDAGWLGSAPTSYTTGSDGAKTLRAWAKDAAGNVSSAATDTCTVTVVQVATPTFSPVAGTYNADQSVTISTATSGATIYWTDDGTAPTTGSTPYTTPVPVTATKTLRAIAVKAGMPDSSIGPAAYTLQCATPTFSPVAGAYATDQTVTIASTTSGAELRYTLDGTTPDGSATLYTTPISVARGTTLKAIAIKAGYSNSAVGSAAYTYPELLANGGFESVLGAEWTKGGVTSSAVRVAIDSGVAPYAGSYQIKIPTAAHPTNVAVEWIRQQITGDAYRGAAGNLSFALACLSAVATSDANTKIFVLGLAYNASDVMIGRTDWIIGGNYAGAAPSGQEDYSQRVALSAATYVARAFNARTSLDAKIGAGNLAAVAYVQFQLRVDTAPTIGRTVYYDGISFS